MTGVCLSVWRGSTRPAPASGVRRGRVAVDRRGVFVTERRATDAGPKRSNTVRAPAPPPGRRHRGTAPLRTAADWASGSATHARVSGAAERRGTATARHQVPTFSTHHLTLYMWIRRGIRTGAGIQHVTTPPPMSPTRADGSPTQIFGARRHINQGGEFGSHHGAQR